jgi:hypothetical protein
MPCECFVEAGRKPRPIKDAMPADGTSLPLATNGDTGTSRFHGSSWTVEPSNIKLYQVRDPFGRLLVRPGKAGTGFRSRRAKDRKISPRYEIFIIQDSYDPEALRRYGSVLR